MSGDYTRFSFDPRNRYSGVLMQQGRVQLDSDWNEEIDILRRRIRTTTLDILGPVGVPYVVSPNAFKIGWIPGPPPNLSIEPGRLYVDGIQIEAFAEDGATYNNQPFLPPQLAGFPPPTLPAVGDAVVYLDVWDREVTYIEDPDLLDVALGGADTTTRRQTVWQVRVDPRDNAACGMPVGDPPSAGRLTSRAIAPPAPDDPCILPPASGYRGLENRLYRVEIHNGGPLGTARFKWSRDNGSIVSAVRGIAVSGTQTTLTVNRIGRDQFLRFRAGDWVTVTDDHRELTGETGEMALVVNIDETNRRIVLDRALPTGANRPFGATAAQIAERHTRVQKWDETGATNTVDGDGLVLTAAGPIPIEDGIEIRFSTNPASGSFRVGDYWVFWARTATATIEELTDAPPRGIIHHYVQLAAINGLGGAAGPLVTDCRPPPPQLGEGECCCTIIVKPGENIQAGIDALASQGGCVCLKTGLHVIQEPLRIARGSILLKAESPGTTVRNVGPGAALIIGNPTGFRIEGIDVLGIDFEANETNVTGDSIVMVAVAERVRISHCGMRPIERGGFGGVHAIATDKLSVLSCRFSQLAAGILVQTRCKDFEADSNLIDFANRERGTAFFGIVYADSAFPCRITRNAVTGALFGILLNDDPLGRASSLAEGSIVDSNFVNCPDVAEIPGGAAVRPVAIDVAAHRCTITANRIVYVNRSYIGIRLTGWGCEIGGNQITSNRKEFDILGPVAIAVGVAQGDNTAPVVAGIVAHNTIVGAQNGIVCTDAAFLVVDGNVIETFLGFAIMGSRAVASEFCGNRIGGTLSAFFLADGRQNRIAGNDCRVGQAGITLLRETGPQIVENRLDLLGLWGIFAVQIAARLDVALNRVVNCARAMTNIAFAVGCFAVGGEAHIVDNEIMDTGGDGGPNAASNADYGIIGDLVLEARISGNLVTYSNITTRNPLREDRALIFRGFLEQTVVLGNSQQTLGFHAQIADNKFIGTGRSALVQLLEFQINDNIFIRFERVSFDQNYCMHLTPPEPQDRDNDATVRLVGRRAIVMGNHVKATTLGWKSVNFNNMPGPFIGNVTAGGAIRHPDFPVTQANFNLIA